MKEIKGIIKKASIESILTEKQMSQMEKSLMTDLDEEKNSPSIKSGNKEQESSLKISKPNSRKTSGKKIRRKYDTKKKIGKKIAFLYLFKNNIFHQNKSLDQIYNDLRELLN